VIGDRVLDEARAVAMGWHHAQVEPRHVLYGLVRVLGADAPPAAPLARVKLLMAPAGTTPGKPTISAEAQAILDGITDTDTARRAADQLVASLLVGTPDVTAAGDGGAMTAVSSTDAPASDTTASVLAELDALVGLDVVKANVRRLIAVQSLNAERRSVGLPEVSASHHLVFTGNPGTGKTTVARLVARLYKTIGILSRGQLVEATRAEMIAGYVGQTALKVQEVVRKAIGGILFIDEAYALAPEGPWDYGNEAIAMLVQMMEENRRDLAVIAAGYPEEMKRFIDSNPGLRSRFTTYIDFPDYTPAELVQIFGTMAAEAKVSLGDGVLDAVRRLCETKANEANFGNGRFVRSVFEAGYANMAARAYADGAIDRSEIEEMLVADIPSAEEGHQFIEHRRIGFRAPSSVADAPAGAVDGARPTEASKRHEPGPTPPSSAPSAPKPAAPATPATPATPAAPDSPATPTEPGKPPH
jgi:Holliday junction resolvasome RuvABC ATP-dependent DNA helicase subunit